MNNKKEFSHLFAVQLAFVDIVRKHPQDINIINTAWIECIVDAGWTTESWSNALDQLKQNNIAREQELPGDTTPVAMSHYSN